MQLSYFWLDNKKYPACFSLGAMQEIIEQYGSIEEMQKQLKDGKLTDVESLDFICDIAAIIAGKGCDYCNVKKMTVYKNAPVNETGIFIAPTAYEIAILASTKDIVSIRDAIIECFERSQTKEIAVKTQSKKKIQHKGTR